MPRKKTKNKKNLRSITFRHLVLLIGGLSVITYIAVVNFPYYLFASHRNIPETKHNIQTDIPKEVKSAHPFASSSATFKIPILMYHYIEYVQDRKDTIRQSLNIEPFVFEEQIKTLKDNNFTIMTMSEVADVLDGISPLPAKPVVLTFDDGYRDFYTDAFPVLKKYNVKATVYVVPGFFDQPNYMYTWQVKELAKASFIELGAHTMHHVYLKDMAPIFAKPEIEQSKYKLEDLIHKPVVSFAYPYGAFDNSSIELSRMAKFRTAVSTIGGITASDSNRFFLFRIRPGYMTGITLVNYLEHPPYGN